MGLERLVHELAGYPTQQFIRLSGCKLMRKSDLQLLVGVVMIQQRWMSEGSAGKFKGMLEECYSDSPERLKASLFGLSLTVKKPSSDQEQN